MTVFAFIIIALCLVIIAATLMAAAIYDHEIKRQNIALMEKQSTLEKRVEELSSQFGGLANSTAEAFTNVSTILDTHATAIQKNGEAISYLTKEITQ